MIDWVFAAVSLLAAAIGARGSSDLCARLCPSSQPQLCPSPCPPCPSCPSLPPIPACPVPVVNLTCATAACSSCPACPPPAKCDLPKQPPFPRGYTPVPGLGAYKVYQEKMKWFEANITCAHDGGYLAIPKSLDELLHLLGIMANNSFKFLHVGFHDTEHENVFLTVLGQPMNAVQQTLWYGGEPNGNREHNCVYLHKEKRRLLDEPCGDQENFVCEISHI